MNGGDNKELIEALKRLEKQLEDIKYEVTDIKRQMPKVPYYGDLLEDIVKAIEYIRK
jgi:regulator of replication initiation timing